MPLDKLEKIGMEKEHITKEEENQYIEDYGNEVWNSAYDSYSKKVY